MYFIVRTPPCITFHFFVFVGDVSLESTSASTPLSIQVGVNQHTDTGRHDEVAVPISFCRVSRFGIFPKMFVKRGEVNIIFKTTSFFGQYGLIRRIYALALRIQASEFLRTNDFPYWSNWSRTSLWSLNVSLVDLTRLSSSRVRSMHIHVFANFVFNSGKRKST